jgi:hypothetical protein
MGKSIRDFIYMDIERLKSIISQAEEGLLSTSIDTKSNAREVTGNIEGSILGFLKSVGGVRFLWQNQATETKSLHDNIYNKVEEVLIRNELLMKIPGYILSEDMENEEYRNMLSDNSFVLANGKVNINDFTQMRIMVEKFNDLGNFFAHCAISSLPNGTPKQVKDKALKEAKVQNTLDKSMIDGFKLFFDTFYKDRVVIKMIPFDNFPNFRLVGNLNKQFLRDDISSIIYKYGTAPVSEWTIFAQIASIPPEDRSNVTPTMAGGQIEVALQSMFDMYRNVEIMAQSVVYPEIAITPIAIYRG